MQNKNILNSPRLVELKKRRRKGLQNKILVTILGFLVIFVFCIYLSHLAYFQITAVQINGNKVVDTEVIKNIVDQEIRGNYLWFFPRKNILLYPKNQIKNTLTNQFARLNTINFVLNNKTLEVSVTERVPAYTWCGMLPARLDGESVVVKSNLCYFLDDSGYIFDEAPYFSGEVYFKFYGKVPLRNEIPSGFYFAPKIFDKLISFKNDVTAMGLKPVAFYLEDSGDVELYLSSKGATLQPEILFRADADLEQVAENFETAITTPPLQDQIKNKYDSLLYIDLRYGNKVYYKFK